MNTQEAERPLLVDIQTVQRLLGVSRVTVYEIFKRGELDRLKIGGSVRVPYESLTRYIETRLNAEKAGA